MTNDSGFTVWRGPSPTDRFLIVENDFARGKLPVPLRALDRVLLLHLLSLPAGWKGARRQLDESVVEGRDAVKQALSRLEAAGYLLRTKNRTPAGSWLWTYAVTIDPVGHPLTQATNAAVGDSAEDKWTVDLGDPSPENTSMAATSGNTEEPQVSPSTENPSLENQSILEDELKKTDIQEDGQDKDAKTRSDSIEGAHAMDRSKLRPRQQPDLPKRSSKNFNRLQGKHLVGKSTPHIVQRLTALWSKAVVESGGELPADAEFSGNGAPVARPTHPVGGQLKAFFEQEDRDLYDVDWLDDMVNHVRDHAQQYAARQLEASSTA
jgi:hypothetical protein